MTSKGNGKEARGGGGHGQSPAAPLRTRSPPPRRQRLTTLAVQSSCSTLPRDAAQHKIVSSHRAHGDGRGEGFSRKISDAMLNTHTRGHEGKRGGWGWKGGSFKGVLHGGFPGVTGEQPPTPNNKHPCGSNGW